MRSSLLRSPFLARPSILCRGAPASNIVRRYSTPFRQQPGPVPLPREEQEIFEQLQRQSTGAFSTPKSLEIPEEPTITTSRTRPKVNQSPDSASEEPTVDARIEATGEGEELHPNVFRGAKPEFEGDVNPKTGEVGGPKNEPLRWGHAGDWSYNGRVTDF